MKKEIGLLIVLLYSITSFGQQIHFVKSASSGNASGNSWENASGDLKNTLEGANQGDTIWVASGVYPGGFTLQEGVAVFGGFNGTEISLNERKLPGTGENLTILDGQNKQTVLTQPYSFEKESVWDGFVIQRGRGVNGGGAFLFRNGVLRRCIVQYNCAGIPALGSYVAKAGGVVFQMNEETLKATVISGENCGRTFQTGVTGLTSKATLESAIEDRNGIGNCSQLIAGRALQIVKKYRAPSPANAFDDWYIPSLGEWSDFVTGRGSGGEKTATYQLVEAALIKNGQTPLGNDSYWSSTAQSDGNFPAAWYVDFTSNDFNNINIWQFNKIRAFRKADISPDEGLGGGIYLISGKLEGCLILQNQSPEGSGVYARGNAEIIHCTFVSNKQSSKANPHPLNAQVIDASSTVKIYNSILSMNTNANNQAANWHASLQASHSAIETNLTILGEANISLANAGSESAQFVDASVGNYRLKKSSPCIDKGNVALVPVTLTTDLDGKTRISENKVSMGAFESSIHTGMIEPKLGYDINIYPNPVRAGEVVKLNVTSISQSEINIFAVVTNTLGRALQSVLLKKQTNEIWMPDVPGIYFIRLIQSDGNRRELKIIVTN